MANRAEQTQPETGATAWSPFRHKAFAVLWTATLLSNIGTWMHDVGAGWLMTSLSPSPLMVALVQAATMLPVFLFALPAGALADIVDRRRLLVVIKILMTVVALALGLVVLTGAISAPALIAFTFAMGIGASFLAPAWQAIVPQLVPKTELAAAIALNSVGINISRAIGPAVGGMVIVAVGVAWPFLLNAVSFLAVMAAVLWWRPPVRAGKPLPAERFFGAMRAGVRYTLASPPLKATLTRAMAFFLFASAYWALLPLIARERLAGDAQVYGMLVTCIGAGAVAGALLLPRMRQRLGADNLVAAGTLGTVLTLLVYALATHVVAAAAASLIAGCAWIAVLSSLNVSAQMSLPDWVRARGLSIFSAVFAGSMALGSVIWGQAAGFIGIPFTLMIAAGGALLGIVATRGFHLQSGGKLDLAPSSHWPQPVIVNDTAEDAGPVMITVEYRVDPAKVQDFLAAMKDLENERRRDGAFAWGIFVDTAEPGCILEYFLEESWLEHLRHHERVTEADRAMQASVHAFHAGPEPPRVRHYLNGPSVLPLQREVAQSTALK